MLAADHSADMKIAIHGWSVPSVNLWIRVCQKMSGRKIIRLLSIGTRTHAIGGTEGAAEVGGVDESPARGDRLDRDGVEKRVGEVAPTAVQPARADPGGDGHVMGVKKAV